MKFNIYSGVLTKPIAKNNYFDTQNWLNKEKKLVTKKYKNKNRNKKNYNFKMDNVLFYYLSFYKKKKINLLDWGGGFGNIFFDIDNIRNKQLSVLVYEPEKKIVDKAQTLFKKINNLKFTSDMNKISRFKVDILYLGSVLQYIFDLDNFLKIIKKIKPKEIIIYDLLACENPTFFSYQNFYGKQMLVKFYNLKFLVKKFKKHGFEIEFISNIQRKILGKFQNPPMSNFKKKYRIAFSKQMILKRIK